MSHLQASASQTIGAEERIWVKSRASIATTPWTTRSGMLETNQACPLSDADASLYYTAKKADSDVEQQAVETAGKRLKRGSKKRGEEEQIKEERGS